MTQLSVILPVETDSINALLHTVRSLSGQLLKEIEILCVYDADNTPAPPAALVRAASEDRRIRLLPLSRKEPDGGETACDTRINRGAANTHVSQGGQVNGDGSANRDSHDFLLASAWRLGIREATGEYYYFPTAGDRCDTQLLSKACAQALSQKLDLVVLPAMQHHFGVEGSSSVSGDGVIRYIPPNMIPVQKPFAGQEVLVDLFRIFSDDTRDKLFRAGFVRDNAPDFTEQSSSLCAVPFVLTALLTAQRIGILRRQGHFVHLGYSSPVARDTANFGQELCEVAKELKRDWQERGLYARAEQDLNNYWLRVLLQRMALLRGDTYERFYERMLPDGGLKELGLANRDSNDWYDPYEAEALQALISSQSAFDYMFVRLDLAREEIRRLENEKKSLQKAAKAK